MGWWRELHEPVDAPTSWDAPTWDVRRRLERRRHRQNQRGMIAIVIAGLLGIALQVVGPRWPWIAALIPFWPGVQVAVTLVFILIKIREWEQNGWG